MRLFLAIDLSDDAAAAVESWVRALAARLGPRRAAELKLADATRLHLTLHFFGEVRDHDVDALNATLAAPFREPAFDLALGAAGTFPSSGQPRVVWLGLSRGREATVRLAQEVEARLRSTPFTTTEVRPFSPHLTVARVRQEARSGLGRELSAALDAVPPPAGESRVDRVTLYRSHLSPQRPRYEVLLHVPLLRH